MHHRAGDGHGMTCRRHWRQSGAAPGGAKNQVAMRLQQPADRFTDPQLPEIKPAEVTGILTDAGLPRASWKLTTGRNVTASLPASDCSGCPHSALLDRVAACHTACAHDIRYRVHLNRLLALSSAGCQKPGTAKLPARERVWALPGQRIPSWPISRPPFSWPASWRPSSHQPS
jgi:hypothetical protein